MTLTEIAVLLAKRLNMELNVPFILQTKELVKIWRQTITIQRLDSKPTDREYFTQAIVVDMRRLGDAECSDLGIGIGEECIMRTVDPIPTLVRTNVLFDYVGAENFGNPYSVANELKLRYRAYERNKKNVKFIWRNGYIYTYNSEAEKIGIKTIFAYPEDITICNNKRLGIQDCEDLDVQYYCPGDIVQKIIQSISSVDYRLQQPDLITEEIKPQNG